MGGAKLMFLRGLVFLGIFIVCLGVWTLGVFAAIQIIKLIAGGL